MVLRSHLDRDFALASCSFLFSFPRVFPSLGRRQGWLLGAPQGPGVEGLEPRLCLGGVQQDHDRGAHQAVYELGKGHSWWTEQPMPRPEGASEPEQFAGRGQEELRE